MWNSEINCILLKKPRRDIVAKILVKSTIHTIFFCTAIPVKGSRIWKPKYDYRSLNHAAPAYAAFGILITLS